MRDSDGKYSINYKNRHYDTNGKSDYCDEYESEIENIENFKKILKALDFSSLVIVYKKRKTFLYEDYEIALDSVKGLGEFVEIEYVGNTGGVDPAKVTSEMIDLLKKTGCGKIERNYTGYPYQILFGEGEYELY